jgi:hypothetical protein
LSNPEKQKATSLIEAAHLYTQEPYEQSTMRSVIINMVHHQEATKTLLREIELMMKEIR